MDSPAPQRTYFFSDTYGGHDEWNPLRMQDPDALISTDFGGRQDQPVHREFDIYGQEQVVSHILRLVVHKYDQLRTLAPALGLKKIREGEDMGTGIFINSAPRTNGKNAEPFYLATLRDGKIRIVTTPLEALSAVRGQVEKLFELPNPARGKSNGLYSGQEQFRSQYTPALLDPRHGLTLIPRHPDDIPAFRKDWHISYVDRFGNVVTHTPHPATTWQSVEQSAQGGEVSLDIEGSAERMQATIAPSLYEARERILSIYQNGNIDLAVKWSEDQSHSERLQESAWIRMGKPRIGDRIVVAGSVTPSFVQPQPLEV